MTLKDPRNVPNRKLEDNIFGGVEADLRNLHLLQVFDLRSLDLGENFLEHFKIGTLRLEIFSTRIPSGLKSLTTMTTLEISKMRVSEITSDAFSGLKSLDTLRINDIPVAKFGVAPFSDLNNLTSLSMSSLNATDISADLFRGLT